MNLVRAITCGFMNADDTKETILLSYEVSTGAQVSSTSKRNKKNIIRIKIPVCSYSVEVFTPTKNPGLV